MAGEGTKDVPQRVGKGIEEIRETAQDKEPCANNQKGPSAQEFRTDQAFRPFLSVKIRVKCGNRENKDDHCYWNWIVGRHLAMNCAQSEEQDGCALEAPARVRPLRVLDPKQVQPNGHNHRVGADNVRPEQGHGPNPGTPDAQVARVLQQRREGGGGQEGGVREHAGAQGRAGWEKVDKGGEIER